MRVHTSNEQKAHMDLEVDVALAAVLCMSEQFGGAVLVRRRNPRSSIGGGLGRATVPVLCDLLSSTRALGRGESTTGSVPSVGGRLGEGLGMPSEGTLLLDLNQKYFQLYFERCF